MNQRSNVFLAPGPEKRSKSETAAAELALRFWRRAQTVLAEDSVSDFSLGANVARKNIGSPLLEVLQSALEKI